jgi:hypothetical protein
MSEVYPPYYTLVSSHVLLETQVAGSHTNEVNLPIMNGSSSIAFLNFALLAHLTFFGIAFGEQTGPDADGFTSLFPKDGPPQGWVVRAWNDVKDTPTSPTEWKVIDGILHGGEPRGSWLMSEKEYSDFVLEFDFKLGERGNSGCALRAPMKGDPAFDGIELQMADIRYNPAAKDSELTGGLYRAVAPTKQVYKPAEWNRYQITLKGSSMKVVLNGNLIQDLDLAEQTQEVKRHDGTSAPTIKERPRKGHIGFQELSRDGDHVQIRRARIKVME